MMATPQNRSGDHALYCSVCFVMVITVHLAEWKGRTLQFVATPIFSTRTSWNEDSRCSPTFMHSATTTMQSNGRSLCIPPILWWSFVCGIVSAVLILQSTQWHRAMDTIVLRDAKELPTFIVHDEMVCPHPLTLSLSLSVLTNLYFLITQKMASPDGHRDDDAE